MNQELNTLDQLVKRIGKAADTDDEQISLRTILDEVGRRSFGPLLLLAGLITLAPIVGDIPGVPTIMGIFVLLTAVQMLLHHEHIWLPEWLLNRSVKQKSIHKAIEWMHSPMQFVDRWLRPRLSVFTQGFGAHLISTVCIIIALAMPVMEMIPFSANGAGAALTAFGLALITHDGFLALLALVITIGTFAVIIYNLL